MESISFQPLLIISGLAFAVPVLLSRLRRGVVPIVVGEILAGIAFGDAGLGLIETNTWVEFLSLFGFAYLMFLSGLELDFGLLSGRGLTPAKGWAVIAGNPLLAGSVIFLLTMAVAFVAAWLLLGSEPMGHITLMGLILSTTSVGIVLPILRERGLAREPLGQTILVAALVADLMTILLITLLAGVLANEQVLEVALVAVLFAVFFLFAALGARLAGFRIVRFTLEELAHATAQLQVRGALALMLVFVVLAEVVGAELILGAFLAGGVISSLSREEGSSLRLKLDAIGFGFFVPVFFITVGASFQLSELLESPSTLLLVPGLIGAAYAVKVLPSILLVLRYPIRHALGAGVLLSSRLSLIIAASAIGLRLDIIDEATNSAIILVAVVTSTLSPALFSRIFPGVEKKHDSVIIVGAGDVGRLLASRLAQQGMAAMLVEVDPQRAAQSRAMGFQVITGCGTSPQVLKQAGASGAKVFIAATRDASTNLEACQVARDHFSIGNLLARSNSDFEDKKLTQAGIKSVSEAQALAIALDNLILRPDIFGVLADASREADILEVALLNRSFAGRMVSEIGLPGDAVVLLVRRGESSFVPHSNTVLELGDLLTIGGEQESVGQAVRLLATTET